MAERITYTEFMTRVQTQRVPPLHYALVCPVCQTVQSAASLIQAGCPKGHVDSYIGFSCEGRFLNSGPFNHKKGSSQSGRRGCDWTLGGLFQLHKLEIELDDGLIRPCFEVATPEQAQALMKDMESSGAPFPTCVGIQNIETK